MNCLYLPSTDPQAPMAPRWRVHYKCMEMQYLVRQLTTLGLDKKVVTDTISRINSRCCSHDLIPRHIRSLSHNATSSVMWRNNNHLCSLSSFQIQPTPYLYAAPASES